MPPENTQTPKAQENKRPAGAGIPPVTEGAAPQNGAAPSGSLKQIRTFQGDVASALERQKESLFSIRATEKLKQATGGTIPDASPDDTEKRQQFFLLILGSIFLIGFGLIGAWFGYREFQQKTAPPVLAVPESRFLSSQSDIDIDITAISKESFFAKIASESENVDESELKHFVLRNGAGEIAPLTSAADFLSALEAKAPGSLVRALEPLFMFGSLGQSRFMIFKLSSFENAFPGMLSWEKDMPNDIGYLFATAPFLKAIGSESVFKDVISRNKDVRVLYAPVSVESTSTEPVLLYSFFDNRMLIITDSLETLRILVERLTQELLSR